MGWKQDVATAQRAAYSERRALSHTRGRARKIHYTAEGDIILNFAPPKQKFPVRIFAFLSG